MNGGTLAGPGGEGLAAADVDRRVLLVAGDLDLQVGPETGKESRMPMLWAGCM